MPPASEQMGGTNLCQCRKKGEPLDFNNLPELQPDALKIAEAKDITLKSWGTKAATLLPEDIHYKVKIRSLCHLAFRCIMNVA